MSNLWSVSIETASSFLLYITAIYLKIHNKGSSRAPSSETLSVGKSPRHLIRCVTQFPAGRSPLHTVTQGLGLTRGESDSRLQVKVSGEVLPGSNLPLLLLYARHPPATHPWTQACTPKLYQRASHSVNMALVPRPKLAGALCSKTSVLHAMGLKEMEIM